MTQQIIYNSLKSSDLDITALSNSDRITNVIATQIPAPGAAPVASDVLIHNVSEQINAGRMSFQPAFKAIDLQTMIADIIVETSAQGSSLLEIHVIDPYWTLLRRNESGWCFIDVDPDGSGYLWPPIEVNFPPTVSDATWRLCQVKPTTDLSAANLVMVFEDKIVAEMREHTATSTSGGEAPTDSSLASSYPNETRAQFIRRCVKTVSKNPLLPTDVGIRFIGNLLPNSDFTAADLTGDEVTLPASATNPGAPAHRQNFTKAPGPSTPSSTTVALNKAKAVGRSSSVVNEIALNGGWLNGEAPPGVGAAAGSKGAAISLDPQSSS